MKAPRIVRTADPCGRPVVYVELVSCLGVFATIDEADFDALVASGVSTRWYLNKPGRNQPGYVRADLSTVKGKIGTIARLILNAGQGEAVGYRNGCRYDLRRSNLVLNEGWAKARAPLPAEQVDEFAPSTLVPIHEAGPYPAPGDYRWDTPTP